MKVFVFLKFSQETKVVDILKSEKGLNQEQVGDLSRKL